MKREVRNKKGEYLEKAIKLREAAYDPSVSYEASKKIRAKQDDCYKRYVFYKEMLSAEEKVKNDKNIL